MRLLGRVKARRAANEEMLSSGEEMQKEALDNVSRHAKASRAWVLLELQRVMST